MALKVLFDINPEYLVGFDKHYTFCYLADPFVDGPARSDFNGKKLSAMKRVLENQYGEAEAIPLMCMILSACGDSNSSDLLKQCAPSPFVGEKVTEEKRILYNFRCLLVSIASKLDSESRDNMVELLQEELKNRESAKTKFQTILLLLERAHQASIILPQKRNKLEEWLGVFERDDLIREYVNQFDPKKQFPGHREQAQEAGTNPDLDRQCSESTGQLSTTVPDPSQPAGAVASLTKNPSLDSAYAEGDSRSRSASHGDRPSLASYGSSDDFRFRSGSTEEKGPREVEELVSGMRIK